MKRTYYPVKRGEAKLTDGFWAQRVQNYLPIIKNMEQILLNEKNAARLLNFGIAAGKLKGDFYRNEWSDGDCYKFIEGCLNQYAVTKDQEILNIVNKYIPWIEGSQEEDGYICTQVTLTDLERWAKPNNHELYNFGHLFTAACVHWEVTGSERLMNVAKKAADYLWGVFSPLSPELGDFGFNPSQIMGLVELYQVTGDEKYLKLADIFVTMRGTKMGTGDQNQTRVPLRDEHMPVGHAVTANYLYAGAADIYSHTEEDALLTALERIWDDMISKRIYITGGVCPDYVGVSERGDMTHESYSDEWNLPLRISYNETCANIAAAMWANRMYNITGKAVYGDWMETIMYNAGISGASLDMMRYFYANPLAHRKDNHLKAEGPQYNHAPNKRFKTFDCWCCPPQLWRTFTSMMRWIFNLSEKGVSLGLFGGAELNSTLPVPGGKPGSGPRIKMNIITAFPWKDSVVIEITQCPGNMDLTFRVPAWCQEATCNSKTITPGVHTLKVNSGDKLTIILPMEAKIYRADPMVEQANGMLAVKRGPVVYCLEGLDIDSDVSIDELALPADASFSEEPMKEFPYDMIALRTEMVHRPRGKGLYHPLPADGEKRVPLRMIPYFSWANREEADMSVWFQRA